MVAGSATAVTRSRWSYIQSASGVALLGALLLAMIGGSDTAYACNNGSEYGHCYAIAELSNGNNTQIAAEGAAYLTLGCIGLPNGATNIITDEMWAGMNDGSWMEGGIITGDTLAGYYMEPGFFVSDSIRGSSAFANEHLGGAAPINTWNLTKIWQAKPGASSTWYGWTAGTGTVTVPGFSNNYAATRLQAGLETSENEGWNQAGVTGLSYLNRSGTQYYTSWPGAKVRFIGAGFREGVNENEMYFNWVELYYMAYFGYHLSHGC
jgi:hypothetical protein